MKNFLVDKTEMMKEFGTTIKHVAIYADNLDEKIASTIKPFIESMAEYGVDCHFGLSKSWNVLHNNLDFYKMAKVIKEKPVCVEFLNILMCDEVWIFDNGYDNYLIGGRLDERLRDLGISVKFLYQTEDTWDFYMGRESSYDENTDEVVDDYYMIGEVHICNNETKPCCHTCRSLSMEVLSEREYELATEALNLSHMIMALETKGMVRQDNSLIKKANQYLGTVNEVLLGILMSKQICDDNTLQTYSAKNDFTRAELDLIMNEVW